MRLRPLRLRRRLGVVLLSAVLPTVLIASAAGASGVSIVGANQSYAGKTYGQWSEAWWRWAAQFPTSTSPLSETTGSRCGNGQSGPVWYLAGIANAPGNPASADRYCTVPADKALLIPVLNGECSSDPNDCVPGTSSRDYSFLEEAVDNQLVGPPAANGYIVVDGEIFSSSILATSPAPAFPIFWGSNGASDPNPFCSCSGAAVSVAEGLWFLLRPLEPGQHTVSIHGNVDSFTVDVTYHLTITENEQ